MQATATKVTPYDEWTRANIGEVVPERMTPFSCGVWAEPMNRLLALSFRHFALDTDRFQFIRSDDGWLTYNLGAVNHLAGQIGLPPMDVAIGSADGTPVRRGRLQPRRLARHAGGLARSTWGQVLLERRFRAARLQALEIADRFRRQGEQTDDPSRLIELAYDAYGELERFLELYADATGAAFSTYVLLELVARRLAPAVNVPGLLRSPGVSVTGISGAVQDAARALADGERAALDSFLREFGHRGWQELELANASWNTDASAIVAAAERYRDGPSSGTTRAGGTVSSPARLPGWRGVVLRAIAARAGEYAAIRENVKHEFYRPIDAIRGLVQKAAARLVDDGRLGSPRDLFFLAPEELTELMLGQHAQELRAIAADRRASWDRQGLSGDGSEPRLAPTASRRLHGVGASAGAATGIARVLRGPEEAGRLQAGDILIVDALDIGWTPTFGLLSGIVTSVGGVLSHPCTVAREMGVPVVAGVRACQSLIADGDRIRIDGAAGDVELLAGAGASAGGTAVQATGGR